MEKEVKIRLPKGKEVELLDTSVKNGHIVVKYNLKEEFIPQHGDIIFIKADTCSFIEIFDSYEDDGFGNKCIWNSSYISTSSPFSANRCGYLYKDDIAKIRLATVYERNMLFSALKEKGLTWNEETKEVEKISWRAERGYRYYYINVYGAIIEATEECWYPDDSRFLSGNYFKTREDAEPYSQKAKELFKSNA